MNSTNNVSRGIIITLVVIIGVLLYLQTDKGGEYYCEDFSQENPATLKAGVVADMIQTYNQNHLSAMTTRMARDETRAILFDLDTIQKFIYHIKKEINDNPSYNLANETLGLRLYFAAYPDSSLFGQSGYEDLKNLPTNYGRRLTVAFVPTRTDTSGKIIDFNPADANSYRDGLQPYKYNEEHLQGNTPIWFNDPLMILLGASKSTMVRNHGQVFPPYSTSDHKLSF